MQPSLFKCIYKCKCSTSTEGSLSHKFVSWHTNSSHTSCTEKTFLRQTNARSMSFNWCKPVCEKKKDSPQKQLVCTQRDPCSILNCFERKGTTQGTRQYSLKFWWVTLREANLMTAGWQTVPAPTNSVLLCQVTPCQASGGELLWWSCPREDIILHLSILGGFFQLGLIRDFWGRNLSASKSNKEKKSPWWWSKVIHLEWQCPRGTHLFLLKKKESF